MGLTRKCKEINVFSDQRYKSAPDGGCAYMAWKGKQLNLTNNTA